MQAGDVFMRLDSRRRTCPVGFRDYREGWVELMPAERLGASVPTKNNDQGFSKNMHFYFAPTFTNTIMSPAEGLVSGLWVPFLTSF